MPGVPAGQGQGPGRADRHIPKHRELHCSREQSWAGRAGAWRGRATVSSVLALWLTVELQHILNIGTHVNNDNERSSADDKCQSREQLALVGAHVCQALRTLPAHPGSSSPWRGAEGGRIRIQVQEPRLQATPRPVRLGLAGAGAAPTGPWKEACLRALSQGEGRKIFPLSDFFLKVHNLKI